MINLYHGKGNDTGICHSVRKTNSEHILLHIQGEVHSLTGGGTMKNMKKRKEKQNNYEF